MKRSSRKLLLMLLMCAGYSGTLMAQQNVQFSQYIFNPLALNTAYAGYRGETYLNAMYRKQWTGLPGAPETMAASVEWLMPNNEDRVAWSARLLADKLGPQQTMSAFGGYTYRIPMNYEDTRRLCFGIGAGFTQYRIDGSTFQYVDENDQLIPVGTSNKIVPDVNFGVYYYTPKAYLSMGVNDLLNVNAINTKYSWRNYTFHSMERRVHVYTGAGYVIPISNVLKFKPSFLWKEDFKGPSNFDFNGFLLLNEVIWVGASYRTAIDIWHKSNLQDDLDRKDALACIVEFFPTSKLRIGYAYDIMVSKINQYENGTHEISIGVAFPHKDKRVLSPRYF
jgi:type IX secretion system PorP/SprF family membrane protein